jgi:hypothetical protein
MLRLLDRSPDPRSNPADSELVLNSDGAPGVLPLLEMLAQDTSLDSILDGVCRMVEGAFRDSFASIMIFNPDRTPTQDHRRVIDRVTRLASVAIARTRAQEEIRRNEAELRQIIGPGE